VLNPLCLPYRHAILSLSIEASTARNFKMKRMKKKCKCRYGILIRTFNLRGRTKDMPPEIITNNRNIPVCTGLTLV